MICCLLINFHSPLLSIIINYPHEMIFDKKFFADKKFTLKKMPLKIWCTGSPQSRSTGRRVNFQLKPHFVSNVSQGLMVLMANSCLVVNGSLWHQFTHKRWNKMAAILHANFSYGFSWMNITAFWFEFLDWFMLWVVVEQVPSHYLYQWWPSSMMHIYIIWSEWVYSKEL